MKPTILHRAAFTPGTFRTSQEWAACGAKRVDGAKFTTKNSRVGCDGCKAKIAEQRAAAKARLAEIEGR